MVDDDDTQRALRYQGTWLPEPLDVIRRAVPEVQLACIRFTTAMRRHDHGAAATAADNAVALLLVARTALKRATSTPTITDLDIRDVLRAIDAAHHALKDLFTRALAQTSEPALCRTLGQLLLTIELARDHEPPADSGTS
jgi:hypothetical protein